MATYSSNTTIKIAGAITTGATSTASNQYAIAVYQTSTGGLTTAVNIYIGPSQGVPATITLGGATYNLFSGVIFQNTP